MKRTHKQRTKKLQDKVIGEDALNLPTENEPDTFPVEIHHNGKNLIVAT